MMREGENEEGALDRLRIYCQNVRRNASYVDMLLSSQDGNYDIMFIQETPWKRIRNMVSTQNKEGEEIVGASMHPNWIYLAQPPKSSEQEPWVMTYVS